MHVYCVPRGVKRSDILKEVLMFAFDHAWKMEPNLHILCHIILHSIFFFVDRLNVPESV